MSAEYERDPFDNHKSDSSPLIVSWITYLFGFYFFAGFCHAILISSLIFIERNLSNETFMQFQFAINIGTVLVSLFVSGIVVSIYFRISRKLLGSPTFLTKEKRERHLSLITMVGIFIFVISLCFITFQSFRVFLIRTLLVPERTEVVINKCSAMDSETDNDFECVLWDTSHGVDLDLQSASNAIEHIYPQLITNLQKSGYRFDINDNGIQKLNLSEYSIIVLNSSFGASDTPYTEEEANLLLLFVSSGGGILFIGEHSQLPHSSHLNLVSEKFGINLGNEPVIDEINTFATHPVTTGVNSLEFQAGGTISVSDPALGVAQSDFDTAIAVSEVGEGKVVAVGDGNFMGLNFYTSEVEILIINIFNWLSQ